MIPGAQTFDEVARFGEFRAFASLDMLDERGGRVHWSGAEPAVDSL